MKRACPKHGVHAGGRCPRCAEASAARRSWSRGRDHGAQQRFRREVLRRADYTCARCGLQDPSGRRLDAHHPHGLTGYDPADGVCLCNPCHCAVDSSARPRDVT